jgi:site-specific DNA-adenine methylase
MMSQLHPFFSYFGSKFRLAKFYPEPQCDEIIEPFAGSAGYSLLYPNKQVTLYELYEPIVELWDYLIKVPEQEILALPVGPNYSD